MGNAGTAFKTLAGSEDFQDYVGTLPKNRSQHPLSAILAGRFRGSPSSPAVAPSATLFDDPNEGGGMSLPTPTAPSAGLSSDLSRFQKPMKSVFQR